MAGVVFVVLLARQYWRPRWRHRRHVDGLIGPLPGTASMYPDAELARQADWRSDRKDIPRSTGNHRLRISVDRTQDAADWSASAKPLGVWAWTFTFRGRRRRVVLRRPQLRIPFGGALWWAKLKNRVHALPWTQTLLFKTATEFLAVVSPAVLLWAVLAWWVM